MTGVSGSGTSSLVSQALVELVAKNWESCYFCRASMRRARRATGLDTMPTTLEMQYRGKNVAEVLGLTVDAVWKFFAEERQLLRSIEVLREVGLGYLRLGQPATELSGGEAQRIKLATELQRIQRGATLYVLDEPTTGLHAADFAGNTVIVVEHDMRVVAASDGVMDIGPGAGEEGGDVVAAGTSVEVSTAAASRTAPYLMPLVA